MARTAEGAALTREQRTAQMAVRAEMLRQLTRLWGGIDPADLASTIGSFAAAAAVLVRAHHRDSATLARRYFQRFRDAEGLGELPEPPPEPEPPPTDTASGTVRGAALAGIIAARRRGFSAGAAARQGLTRVSGSATTLTLAGGRDTIRAGIGADERALGWVRITSGQPCAFCAMIASRSETQLFQAERTADFLPHDHCSCTAEPMYPGSELPEQNRRFREEYERAQREVEVSGTSNDRLNRFRRLHEGRA